MAIKVGGNTVINDSRQADLAGFTSTGSIDTQGSVRSIITALGSTTIDCSVGNYFTITINGASTFSFTNVPSSRAYLLTIEITHTSGAISWPSSVKWAGDTAPILSTGKTHLFMFMTDDGGSRWRGSYLTDFAN